MKHYIVSKEKHKLDIKLIHNYLSNHSYWAKGRSFDTVKKSIENSICFGIYDENNTQCGFARVVSDQAVYAYIMDLFILEEYQGQGLGKMLVEHILNDELLEDVTRWKLDTLDAHTLYAKFGFTESKYKDRAMEKFI
jgi:GNAT superfamily N-acetyltransferase